MTIGAATVVAAVILVEWALLVVEFIALGGLS